ncbi:hypothetical protein ASPZODRAFT_105425, partial [Penicilliopsis zonata CBS 506.65]
MITLVAIAGLYLLYKLACFLRFYLIGRRTGFPLYIVPIFSQSPVWKVLGPIYQPVFRRHLPEWIANRLDVVTHGWDFRLKNILHEQLGSVFAVVSPDECTLWIADPTIASTVLQRRQDFVQPQVVADVLGFFGDHIFAANGETWQRHRKIIAPHLNETVMETVWKETRQQADAMVQYLTEHPESETLNGLRSIAINVLGETGYGQNMPWSPDFAQRLDSSTDHVSGRLAYFQTIAMVTDRFIQAALIPGWMKTLPFMPRQLQVLGRQMKRVPGYIQEILAEKKQNADKTRHSFLDMLAQFVDDNKTENQTTEKKLFLSQDEISGNLWIFTGAGFDTTANTMGYAVLLLAVYPEWQAWIRRDLEGLKNEEWKYNDVFPHCQRIIALMLETLRIYTPVPHISRCVVSRQTIVSSTGTHVLLPSLNVFVAGQSLHNDPAIWGDDVRRFNPARWINNETNTLIPPPKGAFLPWSGGPRVCPGMKMSQVEFVASIATLFKTKRCEPVNGGTTLQERQRILQAVMEDSAPKLTLQVRDPTQVKLRWSDL